VTPDYIEKIVHEVNRAANLAYNLQRDPFRDFHFTLQNAFESPSFIMPTGHRDHLRSREFAAAAWNEFRYISGSCSSQFIQDQLASLNP
jgi:hypothetical protein